MTSFALDLSPLESALSALDRGLARAIPAPADEELRDACIQRFEFCFELSWKMLKRRLEHDLPSPAIIDGMSYREPSRIGAEQELVEESDLPFRVDLSLWRDLPDALRKHVAHHGQPI